MKFWFRLILAPPNVHHLSSWVNLPHSLENYFIFYVCFLSFMTGFDLISPPIPKLNESHHAHCVGNYSGNKVYQQFKTLLKDDLDSMTEHMFTAASSIKVLLTSCLISRTNLLLSANIMKIYWTRKLFQNMDENVGLPHIYPWALWLDSFQLLNLYEIQVSKTISYGVI